MTPPTARNARRSCSEDLGRFLRLRLAYATFVEILNGIGAGDDAGRPCEGRRPWCPDWRSTSEIRRGTLLQD